MAHSQAAPDEVVGRMVGEWKRSMLTFWVLSLLLIDEMYGLAIAKEIESSTQGALSVGASTIYQLLRRLEKRGLVSSRWERTTKGPPRAYYRITRLGRMVVRSFVDDVLGPTSPIAAALNDLVPKVFQRLAQER